MTVVPPPPTPPLLPPPWPLTLSQRSIAELASLGCARCSRPCKLPRQSQTQSPTTHACSSLGRVALSVARIVVLVVVVVVVVVVVAVVVVVIVAKQEL